MRGGKDLGEALAGTKPGRARRGLQVVGRVAAAGLAPLWLALAWLALPAALAGAEDRAARVDMITWRGETDAERGFRDELVRLGFAPRFTTYDCAQDPARLEANLAAAAVDEPDLLYVFGTTVALAAMKTFRDLPIVFSVVSHPDKTGIMKSQEGSGRNVAGASHAVPETAVLNALQRIVQAGTVGILYNPLEANSQVGVERYRALCAKAGTRLEEQPLRPEDDPAEAARALLAKGVEAVILPSDSLVVSRGAEIVSVLNAAGAPTVAALEPYVLEQGALFGLTASYEAVGRAAARLAARILRGENPATLPLAFVRPSYVVNARTAELLGLQLPPDVLDSARRSDP